MAAGVGESAEQAEQNEQQRSEEDGSETQIIGGDSSTAPANETARRSIDAGDKSERRRGETAGEGAGAEQDEQLQSDDEGNETQECEAEPTRKKKTYKRQNKKTGKGMAERRRLKRQGGGGDNQGEVNGGTERN